MENELRNMRKEMDELKSAMKDKSGENLDGMIWRTNSPFTTKVLNHPLPPKFYLPQLESYDNSKDPLDHIESFKTLMLLQMTPDEVMCRAFPTTLKGAARVWFSKIPLGTIADFEQLSKGFVRHFIGGQRHKKPTSHLLNIQQAEGESLRQYVTRFIKELLQVDETEDQVILTTFQAGLLPGDFFLLNHQKPTKNGHGIAPKSSEVHKCKRRDACKRNERKKEKRRMSK